MTFADGFFVFMRRMFMVMMEENYVQFREIGFVRHPAEHYTLCMIGSIATLMTPFFAMMMMY